MRRRRASRSTDAVALVRAHCSRSSASGERRAASSRSCSAAVSPAGGVDDGRSSVRRDSSPRGRRPRSRAGTRVGGRCRWRLRPGRRVVPVCRASWWAAERSPSARHDPVSATRAAARALTVAAIFSIRDACSTTSAAWAADSTAASNRAAYSAQRLPQLCDPHAHSDANRPRTSDLQGEVTSPNRTGVRILPPPQHNASTRRRKCATPAGRQVPGHPGLGAAGWLPSRTVDEAIVVRGSGPGPGDARPGDHPGRRSRPTAAARDDAYREAARLAGQVDAAVAHRAGRRRPHHHHLAGRAPQDPVAQGGERPHRVAGQPRPSVVEVVDFSVLGDLLAELAAAGGAVDGPTWQLDPTNPVHGEVRELAGGRRPHPGRRLRRRPRPAGDGRGLGGRARPPPGSGRTASSPWPHDGRCRLRRRRPTSRRSSTSPPTRSPSTPPSTSPSPSPPSDRPHAPPPPPTAAATVAPRRRPTTGVTADRERLRTARPQARVRELSPTADRAGNGPEEGDS